MLPCIRAVNLKNNGINQEHDKEILQLLSITKVRSIDLSFNQIPAKLAGSIGKKLRDEVTHINWIDLTQNEFLNDVQEIGIILAGFRKQKELRFAGLSSPISMSDQMAKLLLPKHPAMALNMRNSSLAPATITYLSQSLSNP
jgi:hypothetical protein